jgi:hypothetical protein
MNSEAEYYAPDDSPSPFDGPPSGYSNNPIFNPPNMNSGFGAGTGFDSSANKNSGGFNDPGAGFGKPSSGFDQFGNDDDDESEDDEENSSKSKNKSLDKISMGYRGKFKVFRLDNNGIVAYGIEKTSGYCHIWMAEEKLIDGKLLKRPHRIAKVAW